MHAKISMLRRVLAAAAAVAALAGCKGNATGSTPLPPSPPAAIHACETHTATLCADWIKTGDHYVADWSQGSHANIQVVEFTNSYVKFVRDDPSGTSAGMHAVYTGLAQNNAVNNGVVTWTQGGQ
ncbi:MAG: hypothetical protein JO306_03835, partial [Gemmatimonadetes bacterium]|nr:hypothetical protein [Gemmatimonadota bacterium]